VEIKSTLTPLERNRVAVQFDVVEGDSAKIRQINIVGNQAFKEKTLLREFGSTTPGWLTWYTKSDQYSKTRLAGDIEALRSFYLNRGYLEFNVDSTQVSISPDKQGIYITVNVTEGPQYKVSDVKLAGQMLVPEAELQKLEQSGGEGGNVILSDAERQSIERFRTEMLDTRRQLRDVKLALRHDIDNLDGWLKFTNIAFVPLAIAFAGVGWSLWHGRQRPRPG